MNLQEYADSHRKASPGVDAVERWNTRFVPLKLTGRAGGEQYMNLYGAAMGAKKAIALASQCDMMGEHAMGNYLWEVAARLEGVAIESSAPFQADSRVQDEPTFPPELVPEFPADLQPGRLAPMQPVDGKHDRQHYIESPLYWGQRKRDGNKLIIFASSHRVWYQSRSTKLRSAPSQAMNAALMQSAMDTGPYVLEGELYYLDAADGEHHTGAQAVTANKNLGLPEVLPMMKYMPFSCLYAYQIDFRSRTYARRIEVAEELTERFLEALPDTFEMPETFRTADEKARLVDEQCEESREGEIWFDPRCKYESGKFPDERFVRTKYLDVGIFMATNLTPTTEPGSLFGAITITDLAGNPVGKIGTGFDRDLQEKIVKRFTQNPRGFRVEVTYQGLTEYGQLQFARLSPLGIGVSL